MKRLRTIISTAFLGALLTFNNACTDVSSTLNLNWAHSYKRTKQKATFVANAVEVYFPEGVVIYLKKMDKYVTLELLKGKKDSFFNIFDDGRTLKMTTYRFGNPIKGIEKYFIYKKNTTAIFYNINAMKVLEEGNYFFKKVFNDKNANGLRKEESGDFVKTKTKGQERMLTNGNIITNNKIERKDRLDFLLKDENILYKKNLEQFESYSN